MIQIALEFTGESKRELKRLERETPKTFRAAHAAAATRAQNRLRKVMREGGGVYGVPSFAPRHSMTLLLRPGSQAGGKLSEKQTIVKFRRGDGQVIGWTDRLTSWASGYQSAARYEFSTDQKRMLHVNHRQLNGYHIPAYYSRPARRVIDPFAADLRREFPGMVLKAYEKAVARRMKKGLAIR